MSVPEVSLIFLHTTRYLSVCYISFVGTDHFVATVESCLYEREVLELVCALAMSWKKCDICSYSFITDFIVRKRDS
jgi:hypothetical protein